MIELKQIDDALTRYVRPQTFALAVRMCGPDDETPERAKIPRRDLGVDISLCHAVSMARRYGWVIALDRSQSCYIAGISLGFLPLASDVVDGSFQASLGLWGMSKEEAAAAIAGIPKFEYGKYRNVLIAPLHRAAFEPHIILVYGNPAQIWVLLAGYLTGTGKTALDTTLTTGASYTALITRAVIEDECQFALIGVGERLIPHTQDHECALSIPASKIEKAIQGLQTGHSIGVFRYPIPAFLRYSSQHPPGYEEMRSHLLDAES